MPPPFTSRDEELLVTIRKIIRMYSKGTWGKTTIIYNRLVPSAILRTEDSLKYKYRIINIHQVERRIPNIENDVLTKAVHRTIRQVLLEGRSAFKHYRPAVQKEQEIELTQPDGRVQKDTSIDARSPKGQPWINKRTGIQRNRRKLSVYIYAQTSQTRTLIISHSWRLRFMCSSKSWVRG
jgi:hypothetical protein